VHSIHTASDSAVGGINDWLARSLARGKSRPIIRHPQIADAGQGRFLECEVATPLSAIVERLKQLLQIRCVSMYQYIYLYMCIYVYIHGDTSLDRCGKVPAAAADTVRIYLSIYLSIYIYLSICIHGHTTLGNCEEA